MRVGSNFLPSTRKPNSCQWPAASASGAIPEKTTVRFPVSSESPIASSGGLGRAVGNFMFIGSPETTTRASGPTGDGWPWSYGRARSS